MGNTHQLLDRITFAVAGIALTFGALLPPANPAPNLSAGPTRVVLAAAAGAAVTFLVARPQARETRFVLGAAVATGLIFRGVAALLDFGPPAVFPFGIALLAAVAVGRAAYPGWFKP